MRFHPMAFCLLLFPAMFACQASGADSSPTAAIEQIRRHIFPLTRPLGGRLPVLTWQNPGFPTGLEDGRVSEVQQVLVDRGISPLCNPAGDADKAGQYVPILKYRQGRGFPVCILPQGWLQASFTRDRSGRYQGAHRPPAETADKFPCPATLRDNRTREKGAAHTREVLTVLRDHGIKLDLLVVDFESGASLRNTGDKEESVRKQAVMAEKCPRCVELFTKTRLSTLDGYASVVDQSRSLAIREILCDPAREVFPSVHIGNYYAWPINRLSRPAGRWPAYGYESSRMDVAMPRLYMNAGWGGAGRDQGKMNWNAFYCCLEAFSPAASVLRDGELLIPWVHTWLGGRYLGFVMRGRKLPEPWVLHEMACHMMLRGAETFAIWMDTPGPFPANYPYPQYADMGQFVYDVKGIQEGFNEMLQFNSFLRRARPMTYEVSGDRNELGAQTATWSGMAAADKALVRTVSFIASGTAVTKSIRVYDQSVELPFGPRGCNFWIHRDGRVETAQAE